MDGYSERRTRHVPWTRSLAVEVPPASKFEVTAVCGHLLLSESESESDVSPADVSDASWAPGGRQKWPFCRPGSPLELDAHR